MLWFNCKTVDVRNKAFLLAANSRILIQCSNDSFWFAIGLKSLGCCVSCGCLVTMTCTLNSAKIALLNK